MTRSALLAVAGSLAMVPALAADTWAYTVAPGDTLIGIARDLLERPGRWRALQRLNRVAQPRRMPVGRVLQIPVDWLRAEAAVATLVAMQGPVERRAAGGGFEALAPGATLRGGDELRTGPGGAALVGLADGSTVQLAPDSRMTLRALLTLRGSGAAAAELELDEGRAESSVRSTAPRPRFEIRTPVLTLGVRGTEFRAEAAAGVARAEVTRGQVRAGAGAGPVDVAAGFGVVGSPSGVTAPRPLLPPPALDGVPGRVERLPLRLAWEALDGAVAWRAQVRDADDPRRLRLDGRFAQPAAAWPDLPDGDYLLRVRGVDVQGLEGRDGEWRFTLKARPEPPPTIAPAPEARQYGPEARWRWAQSAAAATYRLQVAPQPDFAAPAADRAGLAGPQLELPLSPGVWYWRIRSVRADGDAGPWSEVSRFEQRAIPEPPAEASAKAAADGVTLRWSRRSADERYQLQLSTDAGFASLVEERELSEPELTLDGLRPGRYHLRLRTLDADGQGGPWGTPSHFDVPAPLWWWLGPAALLLLLL